MASVGAWSDGLTTSASDSWRNAIRTYTSKPGGPYRARSHQSASVRSSHRAAAASASGRISVTVASLVQHTGGRLNRRSCHELSRQRARGISSNPDRSMERGSVDELLDVAVERPALEQLQVEVGSTLEDRVLSGLTGDDGEDRHLYAVDEAGGHQRPV